ncbi:Altronate oxidoreductase [compost metagenome]
MNSTSKFKTRVLPSILEYVNRKGELPKVLSFSLAALLAFYQGTELKDNALSGKRPAGNEYQISDDLPVLQLFASLWSKYDGSREAAGALVEEVLSHTEMWGKNLNEVEGFTALVSDYLHSILTNGVAATLKDVI